MLLKRLNVILFHPLALVAGAGVCLGTRKRHEIMLSLVLIVGEYDLKIEEQQGGLETTFFCWRQLNPDTQTIKVSIFIRYRSIVSRVIFEFNNRQST